ncbi:hypothetical protein AAVH_14654 [Aphelenchoides avenae]|nr:hypothetical protein AAVH_14654 [Aphelenchus avenae]
MRSLVVLAVVFATLFAVHCSVLPRQLQQNGKVAQDKFSFLCRPCEALLNEVKRALPTLDGLGVEELDKVIKNECAKLTFNIAYLDKVCERIGDEGVEELYKVIMEADAKINPPRDCAAIRFC